MKIKFDMRLMKYISLFESITKVNAKDCFESQNSIIFIVNQGNIAKAIGKKGSNVKKLESILKKNIKIIEFNEDMVRFVNNVIHPLKAENIESEGDIITITPVDSKTRGELIGRAASSLRATEEIIKRYFKEVKEVKVV